MIIYKKELQNCKFTIEDTHIRTMRPKEGAVLRLTNLNGTIAKVQITNYDYKTGIGQYNILESTLIPNPEDKIIIQSIIDKNYLEKLFEIIPIVGITNITLIKSDNSNVPNINLERLDLILTRACEQCENPYKPTISYIKDQKLTSYLEQNTIHGSVLELPIKNSSQSSSTLDTIIVGPEGGFSNSEVEYFMTNNYPFYSLKCNVLPAWLAGYSYFVSSLE